MKIKYWIRKDGNLARVYRDTGEGRWLQYWSGVSRDWCRSSLGVIETKCSNFVEISEWESRLEQQATNERVAALDK